MLPECPFNFKFSGTEWDDTGSQVFDMLDLWRGKDRALAWEQRNIAFWHAVLWA